MRSGDDGGGWTGGQYSLLRIATGLFLAILLGRAALAAWTAGTGSAVPLAAATLAALAFALGLLDRVLALPVALGAWIAGRGEWGLVLAAAHVATRFASRAAPYGSLAARGRIDPAGGWRRGTLALQTAWVTLFLRFSVVVACTGYAPLDRRLVELGTAPAQLVAALLPAGGPRPWAWIAAVPIALAVLAGWCFGYLPRVRAATWAALALLLAAGAVHRGADPALIVPALLLAWTFEPRWIPPRPAAGGAPETVFYDGGCGLCHGFVRFVLAEDQRGAFRFAPLDSDAFRSALPEDERAALPDSIVVRRADGRLLARSGAVAHVGLALGGLWRLAGHGLLAVPRPLRDLGYDAVARLRHRLFARPEAACPLLPPHLADRFRA